MEEPKRRTATKIAKTVSSTARSAAKRQRAGGSGVAKERAAAAPKGRAAALKELIEKLEARMAKGDIKASLGDYIRLVQLLKDLDEESPREIKVTWVDQAEAQEEKGTKESKNSE